MRAQESKAGSPSSTVRDDDGDVSRIGRTEGTVQMRHFETEEMKSEKKVNHKSGRELCPVPNFFHLFSVRQSLTRCHCEDKYKFEGESTFDSE